MEADESLDLDGFDAAAKLTILANWIMDMRVTLQDIDRTGIRNIDIPNVKAAEKNNSAIKLVASCNGGLRVAPVEISVDDPLCVNGTLNAISFTSRAFWNPDHQGTDPNGNARASGPLFTDKHACRASLQP